MRQRAVRRVAEDEDEAGLRRWGEAEVRHCWRTEGLSEVND